MINLYIIPNPVFPVLMIILSWAMLLTTKMSTKTMWIWVLLSIIVSPWWIVGLFIRWYNDSK